MTGFPEIWPLLRMSASQMLPLQGRLPGTAGFGQLLPVGTLFGRSSAALEYEIVAINAASVAVLLMSNKFALSDVFEIVDFER